MMCCHLQLSVRCLTSVILDADMVPITLVYEYLNPPLPLPPPCSQELGGSSGRVSHRSCYCEGCWFDSHLNPEVFCFEIGLRTFICTKCNRFARMLMRMCYAKIASTHFCFVSEYWNLMKDCLFTPWGCVTDCECLHRELTFVDHS